MVDISPATDRLVGGNILAPGIMAPPSLYNPAASLRAAPSPVASASPPAAPASPNLPAAPSAVTAILAQRDPSFDAFWTAMLPGESGGKNVPNYRYDLGHTAGGVAQITDTNWKSWAPRLGIDVTRFPTAMSAPPDWQKAVAKLMHRVLGAAPWDAAHGGALPVGGNDFGAHAAAEQVAGLSSKAADEARQAQRDALHEIRSLDADSPEFERRIQDAIARSDRATDALMALSTKQPEVPTNQALQHFGSLATILGMLGGMLTRQPAMGALNAAAAAVGAANEGDWRSYKAHLDSWKNQSELLLHVSELQQRRLQNILDDRRLTMAEREAKLNSFLAANKMGYEATLMEAKGPEAMLRLADQQQRAAQQLQYHYDLLKSRLEAPTKWEVVQDSDGTEYRYNPVTTQATTLDGKPYTPKGAAGKIGTKTSGSGREADIEHEISRLDAEYDAANPNATAQQKEQAHFQHRMQAEQQLSSSKTSVRSPAGMYIQRYLAEHPDATSDDVKNASAAYRSSQAIETAFGSGLVGRNLDSLNMVADHILRVKQYAEALQNGNIQRANQIANTVARETGKPEVTSFELGRDIMADEVVRLLTATGGTEADRKGMQSRISAMSSPAQFAGIFDLLRGMTGARFKALEQHYTRGDPERKQYFEQKMLTDDGRKVFADLTEPTGGAQTATTPNAPTAQYKSAADVASAYKEGRITREQAAKILRDNGWAQ